MRGEKKGDNFLGKEGGEEAQLCLLEPRRKTRGKKGGMGASTKAKVPRQPHREKVREEGETRELTTNQTYSFLKERKERKKGCLLGTGGEGGGGERKNSSSLCG